MQEAALGGSSCPTPSEVDNVKGFEIDWSQPTVVRHDHDTGGRALAQRSMLRTTEVQDHVNSSDRKKQNIARDDGLHPKPASELSYWDSESAGEITAGGSMGRRVVIGFTYPCSTPLAPMVTPL